MSVKFQSVGIEIPIYGGDLDSTEIKMF